MKDKLNDALRAKVDEIEEQIQKEQAEKQRIEKMTKKEREQLKLKESQKRNQAKKKTSVVERGYNNI